MLLLIVIEGVAQRRHQEAEQDKDEQPDRH
jgi:hypothetical protein